MPHITASTPRDVFTVAGETFQAYQPYAEGHVLTANEAASLNQTFAENTRNNFAKNVKEAKEAGSFNADSFQAQLDAYMQTYEFGVRRGGGGGGRPSDPVTARAMELARNAIRNKIKEVGGNVKDYSAADTSARAKKAIESNPRFKATAERQLEDEAGIDAGEMDSLLPDETKPKTKRAKATAEADATA